MHTEKIKEVMILHFVKHVAEFQVLGPVSENDVVDILVELVVVRRVFSDVTPKYDLT
jgi:hypothetical protein